MEMPRKSPALGELSLKSSTARRVQQVLLRVEASLTLQESALAGNLSVEISVFFFGGFI